MTTLLIGLLIPLLGTMLGASFVFFMKRDMPERLQNAHDLGKRLVEKARQ